MRSRPGRALRRRTGERTTSSLGTCVREVVDQGRHRRDRVLGGLYGRGVVRVRDREVVKRNGVVQGRSRDLTLNGFCGTNRGEGPAHDVDTVRDARQRPGTPTPKQDKNDPGREARVDRF